MFCYSNNGYSMRSVDNDYIAQTGEVLFTDYATIDQLNVAFPLYNSGIPILTQQEKIAALDLKYEPIFNSCIQKISASVGSDGTTQDTKVVFWQNEYRTQLANKKAERLVIING